MKKLKIEYLRTIGLLILSYLTLLSAKPELKISLLKEVELPEKTKHIIFDFTDPLAPTPKVKFYDKEIVFYDSKRLTVVARRQYDAPISVDYSENEKYFRVGSATAAKGEYQVDFYDRAGNRFFSTETTFSEDIPPAQFKISNTGAIIEITSANGHIIFYDKDGNVLNKIGFYPSSDNWNAISAEFSKSGNLVCVAVNYPLLNGKEKNSEIVLYDSSGNEKWRFKSNQRYVFGGIFLSPKADYALSSHYDKPGYDKAKKSKSAGPQNLTTYIIDAKSGTPITKLPLVRTRDVLFYESNSKDYALVNDVGDRIIYLNLFDGAVQNTYLLPSTEEILGMDVEPYSHRIVIAKSTYGYNELSKRGYQQIFSQPRLEFFDLTGHFISKINLPVSQIHERLSDNKLMFVENGNKLVIHLETIKKLLIYAITED
jgi:hypothetical protein